MLTALTLLGVLVVLFVAAVLATREDPLLADVAPDRADLELPDAPLRAEDVGRLRFSMAVRGYRMDEVDVALERLADSLAARDRRIAELERSAASRKGTPVAPPAPATPVAPLPAADLPPPDLPPADLPPADLPPADLATELVTEDAEQARRAEEQRRDAEGTG